MMIGGKRSQEVTMKDKKKLVMKTEENLHDRRFIPVLRIRTRLEDSYVVIYVGLQERYDLYPSSVQV